MTAPNAEDEPQLDIALEWCGPNFDSERRFVRLETERAKTEVARYAEHPLAGEVMAVLFGQSRDTWKQYAQQLTKYSHSLDHQEERLQEGLVPFKLVIANASGHSIRRLHVTLVVQDGTFDYATKTPDRPTTPEGGKQRDRFGAVMTVPLFGGFARTNIRLEPHRISADLSRIEHGQNAYLVNQIVHLDADSKTRVHYEVNGTGLASPLKGTIELS